MTLSFPAFAKVNLDLRILGVRPDGYHDLRTDLSVAGAARHADRVGRDRGRSRLTCDDPRLPTDRRNLVVEGGVAAVARGRLGRGEPRDVAMHLQKRIPAEAGWVAGAPMRRWR